MVEEINGIEEANIIEKNWWLAKNWIGVTSCVSTE